MIDMSRRLKSIEKKLNLKEETETITIVQFGGELPPDRTNGNTAIHFVLYDEICNEKVLP